MIPSITVAPDLVGLKSTNIIASGGNQTVRHLGFHPPPKLHPFTNYSYLDASVFDCRRVRTLGVEGSIASVDGHLIKSSIYRFFSTEARSRIWVREFNTVDVEGTLALLCGAGFSNWSHLLADIVPRIWQLQRSGETVDGWIVPANRPQFADDLLELAGIPSSQLVPIGDDQAIGCDRMLVPTPSGFAPFPSAWIRQAIIELFGVLHAQRGSRRLLVSRSGCATRRWTEETEAQTALLKLGFETVIAEDLTVPEQLALFSDADVIAGPHGAGLANILLAPANSQLVEIAPAKLLHPEHPALAAISSSGYRRTAFDRDVSLEDDEQIHTPSFSIDPSTVSDLLTTVLQDRRTD